MVLVLFKGCSSEAGDLRYIEQPCYVWLPAQEDLAWLASTQCW